MSSKAYELLTQIKELCVVEGTTEDTKILRYMNLMQWELYNTNFRWRGIQTSSPVSTAIAQTYIAVPTTIGMVYDLRITATSPYGKVAYIDPHKFEALVSPGASPASGKPIYYTWWQDKLWLYPTPDAVYVTTIYGYLKPVNQKIYTTGTAAHTTTTVTGTGTAFNSNANVDTTMFYAYQADVRSDGTYPWTTIGAVSSTTALTIVAYTGVSGGSTVAYVCSSSLTFPEDFDQIIILGASIMYGTRLREFENKLLDYLQKEYMHTLTGLLDSQTHVPDYSPLLRGYISGPRAVLGDSAHRFPLTPIPSLPQT